MHTRTHTHTLVLAHSLRLGLDENIMAGGRLNSSQVRLMSEYSSTWPGADLVKQVTRVSGAVVERTTLNQEFLSSNPGG